MSKQLGLSVEILPSYQLRWDSAMHITSDMLGSNKIPCNSDEFWNVWGKIINVTFLHALYRRRSLTGKRLRARFSGRFLSWLNLHLPLSGSRKFQRLSLIVPRSVSHNQRYYRGVSLAASQLTTSTGAACTVAAGRSRRNMTEMTRSSTELYVYTMSQKSVPVTVLF